MTLCEFAKVDEQSRLYIIGTFDTWIADAFPTTLEAYIAFRIRFDEAGEKKFRFTVIDADGNSIAEPVEFSVPVMLPGDTSTASYAYGGPIPPLKVASKGYHSLELEVDGQHAASLSFLVRFRSDPMDL